MSEPREPLIHSHITDCIHDDHPLAWETVICANRCGTMVHAGNNECMSTWVETGKGNYCLPCWYKLAVTDEWGCIEDEWALPPLPEPTVEPTMELSRDFRHGG